MTTSPPWNPTNDARFLAAVELLHRAGSTGYQIRYTDDQPPTVWVAIAEFSGNRWEAAAGHNPLQATFRLCDQLIDGGECVHCRRPSGFTPDLDPMPLDQLVCWYAYDPELKTFRRGCAGDNTPHG